MQDMIKRQLLEDEHILWEGVPSTGLVVRPIEFFLIPFSLLWGGFALSWNVSVWTTNADLSFKLFGLPFLAMGLYVTVGRFWIDMRLRRRLIYIVTDRRVLILKRGGAAAAKSLDIKRLPALELEERSDGTGTIRFGTSGGLFNGGNFGIWQPALDATPQFLRIADVRRVYQVIQKAA